MTTELTAIRKKLEKKLKEERYIHTLGVMYTAASMAMRHGADVQKAMTAGLLHDCGKYVSLSESPENAYHIIMSSEIIGLTHQEREIVAMVVLYNTLPLDPYEELSDRLSEDDYLCVAKLSAILRVANALDQSHKQKFKNIRITVKERNLVFTVEAFEDISLEEALFEAKTAYFENIYSMKPILKQKRIYNC